MLNLSSIASGARERVERFSSRLEEARVSFRSPVSRSSTAGSSYSTPPRVDDLAFDREGGVSGELSNQLAASRISGGGCRQ
jgi:hypothetical protein